MKKVKLHIKKKDLILVVICIILIEAVGLFSSFLSGDISEEYRLLIKPPFAPPGMVFKIVLPVLYAMLGVIAAFIYREKSAPSNRAFLWFLIQLLLNFSWSIVFFNLQTYWIALSLLILLDILVSHTISLFWKVKKYAALLMILYLIWNLYAAYLNLGIALLN